LLTSLLSLRWYEASSAAHTLHISELRAKREAHAGVALREQDALAGKVEPGHAGLHGVIIFSA
jgi:hypothetical protein